MPHEIFSRIHDEDVLSPRAGRILKVQLQRRVESFSCGEWGSLVAQGQDSSSRGDQNFLRRRRRQVLDDLESRAAQAEALVQMGGLSAARQATRSALQNLAKRLPVLRDPIPANVMNMMPATPFAIDLDCIARNLHSARRGAAAGAAGMTADHLRIILESEHDTALFCRAAQIWPGHKFPSDVLEFLRVGRLTALQKPGCCVHGIVCGDVVRRLVAGTIAQMIAPTKEEATSPFQ